MFGNRRLLDLHCFHNLADRPLLHRQIIQNVPSPLFRYSIECVGGGRRPCHVLNIFPYRNMSSLFSPIFSQSSVGQVRGDSRVVSTWANYRISLTMSALSN